MPARGTRKHDLANVPGARPAILTLAALASLGALSWPWWVLHGIPRWIVGVVWTLLFALPAGLLLAIRRAVSLWDKALGGAGKSREADGER
jgi:hypothetical protein